MGRILPPCTRISSYHDVCDKYVTMSFVKYSSIKLEKREFCRLNYMFHVKCIANAVFKVSVHPCLLLLLLLSDFFLGQDPCFKIDLNSSASPWSLPLETQGVDLGEHGMTPPW